MVRNFKTYSVLELLCVFTVDEKEFTEDENKLAREEFHGRMVEHRKERRARMLAKDLQLSTAEVKSL